MDDNRTDKQADSTPNDRPIDAVGVAEYSSRPLNGGSRIDDLVIGKLVCGSFSGYAYTASDSDNRRSLIIQEYFPEDISVRDLDNVSVMLRDETVSNEFEYGLTRFKRLAQTLSRYNAKGRVVATIEQNDTEYYVSVFDYRCTLKDVLESGKRVPGANIESWLKSCLSFLIAPHRSNLLHLGIQSDSILLDGDGDAIMIGFNSVGPSFHTEPHKPEYLYLPIERIRSEAEMLPASDLYSLAAVLLHSMTGQPPVHAARRSGAVSTGRVDPLDEQLAPLQEQYRPELLQVIRWMLSPQPDDRPASAESALEMLDSSTSTTINTRKESAKIPTVRHNKPESADVPGKSTSQWTSSASTQAMKSVENATGSTSRTKPKANLFHNKGRNLPQENRSSSIDSLSTLSTVAQPPVKTPIVKTTPSVTLKNNDPVSQAPILKAPATKAPVTTPEQPLSPPPPEDTPLHNDLERNDRHGKADWFDDDAEIDTVRRGHVIVGLLGHPILWVGVILLALLGAYLWLDNDQSGQNRTTQNDALPQINVVPKDIRADIQPGTKTEQTVTTAQSEPTVVLESASEITAPTDTQRFTELRKLDALERRLEPYFMEAHTHLGNGQLTTPENANALASFREILNMDPENAEALEGIRNITTQLIERADSALQQGDLDTAETEIAKVISIDDANSDISRVRSEIAQIRLNRELEAEAARRKAQEEAQAAQREAQAEAERQQAEQQKVETLRSLLANATSSFDSGKMVEPPLDNALFFYREILKIDPGNVAANAGIESIASQFVSQARQALATNDFDLAGRNLTTAAAVDPANQDIPVVREQIETRRRLANEEKVALQNAERSQQAAQNAASSQAEMSLQAGISAYYRGNYAEAYSFLRPLAENGNARAQFRLAVMYQNGRGVEPNRAAARKWFLAALEPIRLAAKQGAAWAQADLGSYYEDGLIVDPDYSEAAKWYFRSAEQGYSGAQTNLGVMYANGQGVEGDMKQAVEWFKRAAVQGDSVAKENLRILGYNPNKIVLGEGN